MALNCALSLSEYILFDKSLSKMSAEEGKKCEQRHSSLFSIHCNFPALQQGLDKIIRTLVKFEESLFNMELVLLQRSVQLKFVHPPDFIRRNFQPFFH